MSRGPKNNVRDERDGRVQESLSAAYSCAAPRASIIGMSPGKTTGNDRHANASASVRDFMRMQSGKTQKLFLKFPEANSK
jgi:hypothetical protein